MEVVGEFRGAGLSGQFSVTAGGGTTSTSTEDITMIDGVITDRAITERLNVNSGHHFQMSAKGNGLKIVSSAGGASFMEQNKHGNLNYETIVGTRTNQSSNRSIIKIEGVGDSRTSGGSSDRTGYRMTRYFNQGNEFLIGQYDQTAQVTNSSHDARTGLGYRDESITSSHVVSSFNSGDEVAGPGTAIRTNGKYRQINIDANGNENIDLDLTDEVGGGEWSSTDANQFANYVPIVPLFDPLSNVGPMMDYAAGGLFTSNRLTFSSNGSSAEAPEPTGPPISTGTEPDGTYWEVYNNGDVWIKRTYASEGGDLIKEDWGYYTETMIGLMKSFNQLIEEFSEGTVIESIDEFFADLTEVGESLSQNNNTPKVVKQETLTDIKNRIRNLRKLRQAINLPPTYYKAITEEIKKLVSDYEAAGGDIKDLTINGAPSSPEEQQIEALRKKVRDLIKNFNPQRISPDIVKDLVDSGLAEETADGNAVIIRSGDRVLVLQLHEIKKYSSASPTFFEGRYIQRLISTDRFYSLKEVWHRWTKPDKSEELSTEAAGQGVELQLEIGERQAKEMGLTILLHLLPGGAAAQEFDDNGASTEFWISAGADVLMLGAAVVKAGKITGKAAALVHGANITFEGGVAVYRGAQFIQDDDYGAGAEALLRLFGVTASEVELLKRLGSAKRLTTLENAQLKILNKTCFVSGTPVLTPDGEQNIETLLPGDKILSRPENEPDHPVKVSKVEEVFELSSKIIELKIKGQIIGTTEEHPFFVADKGWVPAGELEVGDQLVGHDHKLTPVESIKFTDRYETVYNLRVKQDHTYFVGKQSWGFSVWVHNTYNVEPAGNGLYRILDGDGDIIRDALSQKDADRLSMKFNADLKRLQKLSKINQKGELFELEVKDTFRNKIINDNETLRFPNGGKKTQIDFETPEALVEVGVTGSGKLNQLRLLVREAIKRDKDLIIVYRFDTPPNRIRSFQRDLAIYGDRVKFVPHK